MNVIAQIKEKFQYLPEKDISICNKLLEGRKFVELKEIIDSDVYKIAEKRMALAPKKSEERFSQKYRDLEFKYNNLKELQDIVSEQAAAFEDTSMYCFEVDEYE